MARISRGILGGFRGKIGNVIGSSWKGIDAMRSMPISVSNPRTNAQVGNRNRFSLLSTLLSSILTTIIKPLNDRFAQKMSGYNLVNSRSTGAFTDAGVFVPAQLILSRGKLGDTDFTCIAGEDQILVGPEWSPDSVGEYQASSDKAYVTVIDADGILLGASAGTVSRVYGTCEISLNRALILAEIISVYISFLRADGTMCGNSVCLNVVVAP